MGTPTPFGAAEGRAAGQGLPRQQQHPRPSEGCRCGKRRNPELDAARVRLLADHVVAWAPGLRDCRWCWRCRRVPSGAWTGPRTASGLHLYPATCPRCPPGSRPTAATPARHFVSASGTSTPVPQSRHGGTVVGTAFHTVTCPAWVYNNHIRVERLWTCLKEWRVFAIRHEKPVPFFLGVLRLAASLDWLKS